MTSPYSAVAGAIPQRPALSWTALVRPAVVAALPAAAPALAIDHPVGADAALRAALDPVTGAQNTDTITFTANITLTADLPAVQNNVTILGQNHVLSGNNLYRGF